MKMFLLRLEIVFKILFQRKLTFVGIWVTRENLKNIVVGEDFDVDIIHLKSKKFISELIIRNIAEQTSDTDFLLKKIQFEHEYEQSLNENK